MRFSRVFASFFFLLGICLGRSASAEIKIKVVDPQDAAVAGAQVLLLAPGRSAPAFVQTTSAEGLAFFSDAAPHSYRVQVLAPGFAAQTVDIPSSAEATTIKLRLATAAETVVVHATRTPVPSQDAGADVAALDHEQLQVMNPVAADDAIRFLPGAVVNTSGQRGGLSSLFVRGGNSNYNKVIVDGVSVTEAGGTIDLGSLPLGEADRLELLRGAQSTLYGSDAMTSVVQAWTSTGNTPVPELRFGADGGNFGTANGYLALSGAHGRVDYNLFGDQFESNGLGVNDAYSNALQGANLGMAIR